MVSPFPEFKPIGLADKPALDAYLRQYPTLASEYTFTNLFAWGGVYRYQLAGYQGGFLILREYKGRLSFLQPLVPDDAVDAVRTCFQYLSDKGHAPVIERVAEDFVTRSAWEEAGITATEDRDDFDYVYDIEQLIQLRGQKFHDKKNLLHQFTKKIRYAYTPLTSDLIKECVDFQHEWCVEKNCEHIEGLSHENCAVIRMLKHFDSLAILGGAIVVDGNLAAFSLGEWLNSETLVIHVEKARDGVPGIYQAINWEFLRHERNDFRLVNREQDLGDEGLRKAKLSYNPVRMINKFILMPQSGVRHS